MAIRNLGELLAAAPAHDLRLNPDTARWDESGADFLALHAADEQGTLWVVRTPRRADVWERAQREHTIVEFLHSRLPVAVPDPQVFTADVIAYPRLDGEPAAVIDTNAGGYVWRFDETDPRRTATGPRIPCRSTATCTGPISWSIHSIA